PAAGRAPRRKRRRPVRRVPARRGWISACQKRKANAQPWLSPNRFTPKPSLFVPGWPRIVMDSTLRSRNHRLCDERLTTIGSKSIHDFGELQELQPIKNRPENARRHLGAGGGREVAEPLDRQDRGGDKTVASRPPGAAKLRLRTWPLLFG